MVVYFKLPFPGYNGFGEIQDEKSDCISKNTDLVDYGSVNNKIEQEPLVNKNVKDDAEKENVPLWMYFFMAIPAIFDLGATALCMTGLQYVDVSIYQMLRGSGIIFVALMKQNVLGDRLFTYQWIGVAWNVVSVVIVGATAVLNESAQSSDGYTQVENKAATGVVLIILGAFIQAMQFAFEEKVMSMEIPAPPLLLIAMEGTWGVFFCLTVVYPFVYYLPGDDHGSYEDPFNTIHMIMNSRLIQEAFIVYFISILAYNICALLVTYLLNSVWHAILDNFRPILIWIVDLLIFYVLATSSDFGEPWQAWSWLQVFGMIVLLYGTAIYNAPNSGSIKLEGQWYAFGFDFKEEYDKVESEQEEQMVDEEWQQRMQLFKNRTESSFYGEHSPHVSIHTQSLRGLASPKI